MQFPIDVPYDEQRLRRPLGFVLRRPVRKLAVEPFPGWRSTHAQNPAVPPDYRPTGSPARDGSEGIASVDDAARAAVAYLRAYELAGDESFTMAGLAGHFGDRPFPHPSQIQQISGWLLLTFAPLSSLFQVIHFCFYDSTLLFAWQRLL